MFRYWLKGFLQSTTSKKGALRSRAQRLRRGLVLEELENRWVPAGNLMVDYVMPTPTGFTVAFNEPFFLNSLHLYGTGSTTLPDVRFYSENLGAPLSGSLVVNAAHTAFTFVETTTVDVLGALPDGTYIVSVLSSPTGLTDVNGLPLNTSNNTDTADNLYAPCPAFTTTFTLNTLTAFDNTGSQVALTLPAFAQGPGAVWQTPSGSPPAGYVTGIPGFVNVQQQGSNPVTYYGGIPAILSDGNNTTTASFQVTYNTALLTVTGAQPDATTLGSYPSATFTRAAGTPVAGMETDTFTFNTHGAPLATGQPWTLGELLATVPNTTGQSIYHAEELLPISHIAVDGGSTLPVVAGAGFQVVAYLGDGSGDGQLTTTDATLADNVALVKDTGFAAYPLVDPVVMADTDANNEVDGTTVANLAYIGSGHTLVDIPVVPAGAHVAISGAGSVYSAFVTPALQVSFSGGATLGTSLSVTVSAVDPFGNSIPGYSGPVQLTSSDGQAILPGNVTLIDGVGTFTATFFTAGSQTITATNNADGSQAGTTGISVSPAATTQIRIGPPAFATAGHSFTITVTALDPYGNLDTGYSGTIHFTSTDAGATLPADSTLPGGTKTFTITLNTLGNQTLTVTDTANSSLTRSIPLTVYQPLTANGSGTAFVAAKDELFFGAVATFTGPPDPYTALILWGDGQSSAGTITGDANAGYTVLGVTTYPQDGSYPVAVQIVDPAAGTSVTALGLGVVVPLKEQTVLGTVVSFTLSGGGSGTQTGSDAGGTFTLSLSGSVGYLLETNLAEPETALLETQSAAMTYSLATAGTDTVGGFALGAYTLTESGTNQKNLALTYNDLTDATTGTECDTDQVTLVKSGNNGTGAFAQTMTQGESSSGAEAGTDGTGDEEQSWTGSATVTLTTSGNYLTGVYTLAGSQTNRTTAVQTGNDLAEDYTEHETDTTSATVTGSGNLNNGSFTETDSGTDATSLGNTETDAAGDSDGTAGTQESFSRTVSGSTVAGTYSLTETRSGTDSAQDAGTEETDNTTQTEGDSYTASLAVTGNTLTGNYTRTEVGSTSASLGCNRSSDSDHTLKALE